MATPLRRWLTKHPHPHTIRGWTSDDDTKMVKLGVARSRWLDAESALADCYKLEALDGDGNTLRVCELDGADERAAQKGSKGPELVDLARLLNESADKSAERHEGAYRLAYDQQRLLVEVMSSRLAALEKAWHQLLMAQQTDSDPNQGMVAALLASAFGGAPPTTVEAREAPADKPNGKVRA